MRTLFDLLGSTAADAAEHALTFAAERHKVLANNLANIDTPGYRMRDLSVPAFQQALDRAITRSREAAGGPERLVQPRAAEQPGARLRTLVFHDDNDRSVEKLTVAMMENANRHNQVVNLLRSQIRMLRTVIAGTVSQ